MAWTLWPGTTTLPSYNWDKTAYSDYRPGGASCEPSALDAITSQRERARKRDACEEAAEQHRIETNDLKQQTRAADAAAAAVVIAEWQAKATVGGLIIAFYTLVAAVAAAYFARQAGEAAQGALRLDKTVSAAQLRPYLFINKIELEETEPAEYQVTIWLKNFGNTPARNIAVSSECFLEADILKVFDREFDRKPIAAGTAAPNHHRRTFDGFYLTANGLYRIGRNKLFVILRVRYWYEDDSGNTFEEAANYHLTHRGLETKTFYLLNDTVFDRVRERREWDREYRPYRKLRQSRIRAAKKRKN